MFLESTIYLFSIILLIMLMVLLTVTVYSKVNDWLHNDGKHFIAKNVSNGDKTAKVLFTIEILFIISIFISLHILNK